MNDEELRSTIEQIKAQVKAKPENKDKNDDEIDEIILDGFLKSYTEGEMTKEDLLGLAEMMGYEPDEGFEQDPEAPAEFKPEGEQGGEEGEAPAPAEETDLEATRTMEPGESKEEFQEKIEDVKEGNDINESETEEEDETEEEGDEDAEREAASKLWKMDLSKKD